MYEIFFLENGAKRIFSPFILFYFTKIIFLIAKELLSKSCFKLESFPVFQWKIYFSFNFLDSMEDGRRYYVNLRLKIMKLH